MTVIKLCEDEDGYLWATALPDHDADCAFGPIVGPPAGLYKAVHNALVKEGIYTAFDLMGKRPLLLKVLRDVGVGKEYARTVYHIYQTEYFMGMDE